jgi:hypothetical protein
VDELEATRPIRRFFQDKIEYGQSPQGNILSFRNPQRAWRTMRSTFFRIKNRVVLYLAPRSDGRFVGSGTLTKVRLPYQAINDLEKPRKLKPWYKPSGEPQAVMERVQSYTVWLGQVPSVVGLRSWDLQEQAWACAGGIKTRPQGKQRLPHTRWYWAGLGVASRETK